MTITVTETTRQENGETVTSRTTDFPLDFGMEDLIEMRDGILRTHNGTITVENPATGNHKTFLVHTQPDDAQFAPGSRMVAVETWTNPGESFFKGFGFIRENGEIAVWKKCRNGDFPAYAKMLSHPERFMARGINYLFEGSCRVCNRRLTNPTSIRSGIGPVCAGRV